MTGAAKARPPKVGSGFPALPPFFVPLRPSPSSFSFFLALFLPTSDFLRPRGTPFPVYLHTFHFQALSCRVKAQTPKTPLRTGSISS